MQRKDLNCYWRLGALSQYLLHVSVGAPLHGEQNIVYAIRDFANTLEAAGLPVSVRVANPLQILSAEMAARPSDAVLTAEDRDKLFHVMRSVRDTVGAEMQSLEFFATTPKRLDTAKLTHNPSALFAAGIFDVLPELTRYDLKEAGLCLAYDRPTAAAFHLLRATENSLRTFYCSRVRRSRSSSLMWGPILTDFPKHPTVVKGIKDADALLSQLDYIRKQFRNPTQHPEKVYDIEEAQDLWSLCVDVITRMAR